MTSNDTAGDDWPRPAVSVMVFRDDTVLLGQRAKPPYSGIWSLPGGRIEPGETVRDAGLRELAEETGVVAELNGQAGAHDIIIRDETGALITHYVLTVLVGRWLYGQPVAGSDCCAALWVPVKDLEGYEMTDGTAELIRTTFRTRRAPLDRPDEAR